MSDKQKKENNRYCFEKEFALLSDKQKKETFSTCSPEKQIELYLTERRSTVPPNYKLTGALASSGQSVVPAIIARIELSSKERYDTAAIPDLLFILLMIQDRGYYAVSEDKNIMKRLEKAVAALPRDMIQHISQRSIFMIKGGKWEDYPVKDDEFMRPSKRDEELDELMVPSNKDKKKLIRP